MMRIRRILRSPAFFRIWVGYGAIPVMVAAFFLAFREGWGWGLLGLGLHATAWLEASTGLCARCTHLNCGLHGRISRRVFGIRPVPLSRTRKVVHLAMDLALSAWWLYWLWIVPSLGLAGSIWFLATVYAAYPWNPAARENAWKYRPSEPGPSGS